jgi:hypothetical protein
LLLRGGFVRLRGGESQRRGRDGVSMNENGGIARLDTAVVLARVVVGEDRADRGPRFVQSGGRMTEGRGGPRSRPRGLGPGIPPSRCIDMGAQVGLWRDQGHLPKPCQRRPKPSGGHGPRRGGRSGLSATGPARRRSRRMAAPVPAPGAVRMVRVVGRRGQANSSTWAGASKRSQHWVRSALRGIIFRAPTLAPVSKG